MTFLRRHIRRLVAILASTLFITVVLAASAQAWSFNQAFNAAWKRSIWWCNNYQVDVPYPWRCYQANTLNPDCHGTGVNVVNKTQWYCYMYWVQQAGYTNTFRSCTSQVNYDPYGKIVYSILNNCTTGIISGAT